MIQDERIRALNKVRMRKGAYVLYWMQASQRVEYNHALQYAIRSANRLGQPVVVFFGLTPDFPNANLRHYHFMLEGLKEVKTALKERDILMVVRQVSPERGAVEMAGRASMIVADRGYLRIQRQWRSHVAEHADCPVIQVESDVVIPPEVVSRRQEYAARTIRPKIKNLLADYLIPLVENEIAHGSLGFDLESLDLSFSGSLTDELGIDGSVKSVSSFKGGTTLARRRLEAFLDEKLERYHEDRNDPNIEGLSGMSPYLHFGHISPLYIALRARECKGEGTEAFLEELIVRRELSINFVLHNPNYDSVESIPDWATETLAKHQKDSRPHVYSRVEMENADTDDPYWNAAQKEMLMTGKMHGYMRMYWGKKILEWSRTPEEAFETAVYLNDKYELDGRDPNGYTGVAWCFGLHDRPWPERKIFGTVRYMNDKGLKRKFDADGYVNKIKTLKNH